MQINIQSVHFTADQKLIDYIEKRSSKLVQYHDRIISMDFYLRLDQSEPVNNKISEIKLGIPDHTLFAKFQSSTFEESVEHTVEAMVKQLKKQKEKSGGIHHDKASSDSLI